MTASATGVDLGRLRESVESSVAAEVAAASDGRPVVYPLTPFYDADREAVVITSPPAYAGKVERFRRNPAVTVNLYDGPEPLQLRGRATVRDDDVRANADYVADLIRSEPDSEKRDAFESGGSFLESRLGRLLMDWYTLRVVVEIEPLELVAGREPERPPAVPAWDAVGMDATEAGKHQRVVLGSVEDDRPVVTPVRDLSVEGDVATVELVADTPVEAGNPACLLCHWHSPDVRQLGQRLVRGRCVGRDGTSVRFRQASTFSMRQETALDFLRSVVRGKRRTRAYFDESNPLKWFW